MNDSSIKSGTRDVVIDEILPHAPETIWKALTNGSLMSRWLMTPHGFEPVKGNQFTFRTPADGEWDGVIRCEVVDLAPNERFVFSWKTGYEGENGYVSRLDTLVSWTLTRVEDGTRVRLVHSGFDLHKLDSAFRNINEGWPKVIRKMLAVIAEEAAA